MRRIGFAFLTVSLTTVFATAQTKSPESSAQRTITQIICGHVWDGKSGSMAGLSSIRIEADRITEVRELGPENAKFFEAGVKQQQIVLVKETCLPGLIDTHTHILLQGDITAADYDEQLLKQSPEYRTILATVNARRALEYGFTTIRDLETEGAGYADVDVKRAIENGVIPGPRM
jgi:imidazolonepropionase-like amidohydrolase